MDEPEFRRFVAARGPALCRSAYLLTGDWHLAEDLVQTALTRTWGSLWRLRNADALESYVRRTMVRSLTSWRRRMSSQEVPIDASTGEVPGNDLTDAVIEQGDMWRSLQQLPAQQRAVLVLRYYEDLSEHQIADILGCSPGTVKSHAARGIRALRQQRQTTQETADEQN